VLKTGNYQFESGVTIVGHLVRRVGSFFRRSDCLVAVEFGIAHRQTPSPGEARTTEKSIGRNRSTQHPFGFR
jgi:hypothetical protein